MGRFDAELYLRLYGEEALVGGREPENGPWRSPLLESARALVAVGAISSTKAEAVIDDYALANAMRSADGLEERVQFGRLLRIHRGRVKPLEPRRVVACDHVVEHGQGTLHVHRVALGETFTTIAITWRPTTAPSRSRRHMFSHGPGAPLQATVTDDRGTSSATHFSGGGSDDTWEGHLTADQPLALDTAWIEIDGARVDLTAEPSEWEVSIEDHREQSPAQGYLWRRLAISSHFDQLPSLDPVIDALLAAGALEPDDSFIDEAHAVLEAMPRHPGMPPQGAASRHVPQPWRSILRRQGRHDGPEGTVALAAVTPVFDGFSVAVSSLESRSESFAIEVEVAPSLEDNGPLDWSVSPRRLAWWGADDRGNHYLGQIDGWSGGEDHSSGKITFWPALDPRAAILRIMPTAEKHRAVISVLLPWAKQEPASPEAPT